MKAITTHPRSGWVKASESVGPEVMIELSRLSKENAELRTEFRQAKDIEKQEKLDEINKIVDILKLNKTVLSFYYKDGTEFEAPTSYTLLKTFMFLAPELMVEKSITECCFYLGLMCNPNQGRKIRDQFPVAKNLVKNLLAAFTSIDIIRPSTKKHSVKDVNEYWTISEKGKSTHALIIRKNLEAGKGVYLGQ